jgi:hypothetical protein
MAYVIAIPINEATVRRTPKKLTANHVGKGTPASLKVTATLAHHKIAMAERIRGNRTRRYYSLDC